MTKTTECRCAAGPNVCKRPGHKREHRAATCEIRSIANEIRSNADGLITMAQAVRMARLEVGR